MKIRLSPVSSRRLLTLGTLLALLSPAAYAQTQTVAYYNFGSAVTGTASLPLTPTSGNGTITSNFAATNIVYFTGTTINAQNGDAKGGALALVSNANNGKYFQINASSAGVGSLMLSFAIQKTATGFSSNQLSYSADGGTTFTNFGSPFNPTTDFTKQASVVSFDLSGITTLNNNPLDVFRFTLSGNTSTSGNNRVDNLLLTGVPVPLTATYNYNNDGSNFSGGFTTAIPAAGTTTGDTLTFGGDTYTAADDLTNSQPLNANVVTFSNTGAVTLNRGAGQNLLTLGGTAPIVNFNNSGTLNVALDVVLSADTTFTGTGSATIGGVISGTGGLLKSGAGTLTLTGTNTFTGGTTISGGTVSANAASLGAGAVNTGTAAANTLDLEGGTGTVSNTITGQGAVMQGGAGGGANVSAGAIVTLTGTNSYTGGTTVSAGTLSGNVGSFGSGPIATGDNGVVDYTQGGPGTVNNNITGTGKATFGGNTGGPNGNGGAITYTGTDSAAGGATVNSGTLLLNHSGGGAVTGPVAVATGAIVELGSDNQIQQPGAATMTLAGGTLQADGHSEGAPAAAALGGLVLTGTTSTLDFGDTSGTSPVILAFADSSALTWTGTVQLTGYTDGVDQLYIGTTNDLTPGQLAAINFNGNITSQLPTGQIAFTPAPEPSGIVSTLLGIGMLLMAIARCRRSTPTTDTVINEVSC